VKDYGDKLNETEKKEIEEAIERCKKAKDTSSEASEIKSASEDLMTKSHKLAEHLYKDKGAGAQAGADPSGTGSTGEQAGAKGPEEEVVEAEFEDVDKDKKGN
jgi:molecular chaperone DnaK